MTPNPTNIRLLITALRSGEYEQGHRRLRTNVAGHHSYCCLGVACEIYRLQTGQGGWADDGAFEISAQHVEQFYLTGAVMDWYGFSRCNPAVEVQGRRPAGAATHNDEGATFEEIADGFEQLLSHASA